MSKSDHYEEQDETRPLATEDEVERSLITYDEQTVRKRFIRKVYSILLIQLLISFATVCFFQFIEPVKEFTTENPWMFWVALGVVLAIMIMLLIFEGLRSMAPSNYVMIAVATVAMSVLLGITSVVHAPDTVLLSTAITANVVLVLMLFAMQSRYDFTTCVSMLLVLLLLLLYFVIVVSFVPSLVLQMIYSILTVFFYCLYLVIYTQMLMGHHMISVTTEDYICGAISIYIGIIGLFLQMLGIVGPK